MLYVCIFGAISLTILVFLCVAIFGFRCGFLDKLMKLLETIQSKLKCCSTIHRQNRTSKTINDFNIKVNIRSRLDDVPIGKISALKMEVTNIQKYPPDIYIINENGRRIRYIMCV